MYMDIEEYLAAMRGAEFTSKFSKGLPIGLKLPSGIVNREDRV
jgi:salicylate hydroxylase